MKTNGLTGIATLEQLQQYWANKEPGEKLFYADVEYAYQISIGVGSSPSETSHFGSLRHGDSEQAFLDKTGTDMTGRMV